MSRWGVILVTLWVGVLSGAAHAGDTRAAPPRRMEKQQTGVAQEKPVKGQNLRHEVRCEKLDWDKYVKDRLPSDDEVQQLRQRAEQGDTDAQLRLGSLSQDYAEARQWYQRAADQGNVTAQFQLGLMYEHGSLIQAIIYPAKPYVPPNYAEAVKWYRRAAAKGHVNAQFQLGSIYDDGYPGVSQDYTEAVTWYRQAAAQGHASAQFILGFKYAHGEGVPQNYYSGHQRM